MLFLTGHVEASNSNDDSFVASYTMSTGGGICVTCSIEDGNDTCVLVIHPKASILSQRKTLLNAIDVVLLNRSGDYARGCIDGINLSSHVVAVFLYNTKNQTVYGSPHLLKNKETGLYYTGKRKTNRNQG